MPQKNIIGLMSGTSLDGLDIACCRIECTENMESFRFSLIAAETIPYPEEWRQRLQSLNDATAFQYALADVELGHYYGEKVRDFIRRHQCHADAIASHGHTIFHQPHLKLTTQIGDGDAIAAETGLPTVFNFRRLDVALGGQGAPLVPIGDRILFADYNACLNLGGFCNISFENHGQRMAYDVAPCNMAFNYLTAKIGLPYDHDGLLASKGRIDEELLQRMDELDYYQKPIPKSLGKEWFDNEFRPLLDMAGACAGNEDNIANLLATVAEHVAHQVVSATAQSGGLRLLATGGGAHNTYLLSRFKAYMPGCDIATPKPALIDYKEAIVFALLGFLRLYGKRNCLASATGALRDCCGGDIAGMPQAQE